MEEYLEIKDWCAHLGLYVRKLDAYDLEQLPDLNSILHDANGGILAACDRDITHYRNFPTDYLRIGHATWVASAFADSQHADQKKFLKGAVATDIRVHPAFRPAGVGAMLYGAMLEDMAAHGFRTVSAVMPVNSEVTGIMPDLGFAAVYFDG